MSNDGYDALGFISLSFLYLTLGIGCLFSTALMARIGCKESMIIGCVCDTIWILSNLIPAYSAENPDSTSFVYSTWFIYIINCIVSLLDGFGDAI